MDINALLDFALLDIRREEGLRLYAYPDPLSGGEPFTVGYGATGNEIGPNTTWTEDQAESDLVERATKLVHQIDTTLPWFGALSIPRQAVLLDMAYQLGLTGLLAFHRTLADIEAGKYVTASLDMLQSRWARQVPERAQRLAAQMSTGAHQGA